MMPSWVLLSKKLVLVVFGILFLCWSQVGVDQANADEAAKAKEEEKEHVATGVVASSTKTGRFGSIDVQTDGASPGDEVSVVNASVSRLSREMCVARIINSGKKNYSISFAVVATNSNGSNAFTRSFSGTVKAGETLERQVSNCKQELNLNVVLRSAKPLN